MCRTLLFFCLLVYVNLFYDAPLAIDSHFLLALEVTQGYAKTIKIHFRTLS